MTSLKECGYPVIDISFRASQKISFSLSRSQRDTHVAGIYVEEHSVRSLLNVVGGLWPASEEIAKIEL